MTEPTDIPDAPTFTPDAPSAAEQKPASDKPWHVKSADGRRTFFSGLEEDARTFIRNNFPRIHVEPGNAEGQPDVHLHSPSGDKQHFDGANFVTTPKE